MRTPLGLDNDLPLREKHDIDDIINPRVIFTHTLLHFHIGWSPKALEDAFKHYNDKIQRNLRIADIPGATSKRLIKVFCNIYTNLIEKC